MHLHLQLQVSASPDNAPGYSVSITTDQNGEQLLCMRQRSSSLTDLPASMTSPADALRLTLRGRAHCCLHVPAGQATLVMQTPLINCTGQVQAVCQRQNVTITLSMTTLLANGTTIVHQFLSGQANGTVFDGITVTHLATPTQLNFQDLTALPVGGNVYLGALAGTFDDAWNAGLNGQQCYLAGVSVCAYNTVDGAQV